MGRGVQCANSSSNGSSSVQTERSGHVQAPVGGSAGQVSAIQIRQLNQRFHSQIVQAHLTHSDYGQR
jgi:hypothetical protein